MTDSQPDEGAYGLVMPLVVCQDQGGPYEADAFVAGTYLAKVEAAFERLESVALSEGWYVPTPLVPQLDLLAMHHRHQMVAEPWDEHPDEWAYVCFAPAAVPAP